MKSPFFRDRSLARPTSWPAFRVTHAFTLIELLVVIAIIGILAAMLLGVLASVKKKTLVAVARVQAAQIVAAVPSYNSDYGRMPVTKGVTDSAYAANQDDYTYGTFSLGGLNMPGGATQPILSPNLPGSGIQGTYETNNAELMAVLLDLDKYGNGVGTVNQDHAKNPQRTPFLSVTYVTDPKLPGVGPDGVYRDPWGNPFIITLDLNNDGKCKDAFYRRSQVSRANPGSPTGLNGLFNSKDSTGVSDDYESHGQVMVWSAGPDGMIDPATAANKGANKDNVLSWK